MHIWKSHVCSNKPVCKKQTCVSHISTDSEIISLDTGLRMDGIPVLDPWDLVIVVMHSNSNQRQKDKQARRNLLPDRASEKRVNFRLTKYREMFEVRVSLAAKEKTPTRASGKCYDMENHAMKCVERFCESANKTTQQFYTVSTPVLMTSIQRRRIEIRGRIVNCMLSNASEMSVCGTDLRDGVHLFVISATCSVCFE